MYRNKNHQLASIAFNRNRLKDDFALYTSGNKYIDSPYVGLGTFTDLDDWSYCFFINNDQSSSKVVMHDFRGGGSPSLNGVQIGLIQDTIDYNIQVRFGLGSQETDFDFSYKLKYDWLHTVCINYDSTLRNLILIVDGSIVETLNIGVTTISAVGRTGSRIFAFRNSFAVPMKGFLRDIALFDRMLTPLEFSEMFNTGLYMQTLDDNKKLHYPLNHIPYVDGVNRVIIDISGEGNHGNAFNWSDDNLGLNVGTSDFTAYADYYTRVLGVNFAGGGDSIIYKGKEIRKFGLKFNGTSQYLRIPNFNYAKDKSYTIEVAFTMPSNVPFATQQVIISKKDGVNNYIEVVGDATKKTLSLNYIDAGSQVGVGNLNTSQDISKMQYSCMRVSPSKNISLPIDFGGNTKVFANNQINTIQYNTIQTEGINPNNAITVGFDNITGNLNIGFDGVDYFEGTLFYLAIWEGQLSISETKVHRNDGILNNPEDPSFDSKSSLKLLCDFNNPVDNLGTLQINDLSTEGNTADAIGWANLAAIEAAREEKLSKF